MKIVTIGTRLSTRTNTAAIKVCWNLPVNAVYTHIYEICRFDIHIVTKSCRSNCADFVTNLQLTSCGVNSENFQTGNPFQVSPSTRKNHLRGRDKENFPFFFFLLSMYNNPEAIASPPYISPHTRGVAVNEVWTIQWCVYYLYTYICTEMSRL